MNKDGSVRQVRVALTVEDFEGAATIEIVDRAQAEFIDKVEAGEGVSGPVRLALGVTDVEKVAGVRCGGTERRPRVIP